MRAPALHYVCKIHERDLFTYMYMYMGCPLALATFSAVSFLPVSYHSLRCLTVFTCLTATPTTEKTFHVAIRCCESDTYSSGQ